MAMDITEKLSHFQWLLRKKKHRNYALNGAVSDKAGGQGRILSLLKIRDAISIKDISYLLGVNPSTLNEMLGKLEKKDYIYREASLDDRRVTFIRLSEKGKKAEQFEQSDCEKPFFSCLDENEQKEFCGYLDRLIVALQNELGISEQDVALRMQRQKERYELESDKNNGDN